MRYGLAVTGLFLLLVLAAPALAIVYGGPDGNGHPNVALISRPDPNNPGKMRPVCSGTLIHARVVLTAGHCTDFLESLGLSPQQVKVSFDPNNALEKGLLDVEKIITHPEYNDFRPQSNPHDVGLLILSKAFKKASPAVLPRERFLDGLQTQGLLRNGSNGAKFTVVGFGATLEFPPPQFISPDGQRRVAQSEYQALQDALLKLSQNQATDNGGTCSGDSGGPVFYPQPDGSEVLVGITSSGDAVCVATGVYYRADIADTLEFIRAATSQLK